mgnify:CR=1 FL=1
MATRFYLPSSGTTLITPAYDTGWEDTSIAARLYTKTYKENSAMTTISFADATNTLKDILFRQYITPPIVAQTIAAQTLKFQIRGAERIAGNNMFTAIGARVVSNDGITVVGTLLAVTKDGLEVDASTTLENRLFSATTTQVIANEGDRIVIEIGTGGDPANTGGADHDSDLRIGDVAVSDLAENDTAITDDNPWVEFTTLTMRNVDYKLSRVSDDGTNTTVVYRVCKNDGGSPIVRSSVLATETKVLSGSNTLAQCRTNLNDNECFKWGVPISAQQ